MNRNFYEIDMMYQGHRKELFKGGGGGGGVLNGIFQKRSFFIDLSPNTLYRKCKKFAPKKEGSSDPRPFPTPLYIYLNLKKSWLQLYQNHPT